MPRAAVPVARSVAAALIVAATAVVIGGLAGVRAGAQAIATYADPAEARRALADARSQEAAARGRAERLEIQARQAGAAAQRSAAEAAAAAARIQQTEAAIGAQQARAALLERQRSDLRARLAERQQPLVRLTAALQRLARRPLLFTLFRPGSVADAMHLRASLASMLPEITRRTAGLRSELDRLHALRAQSDAVIAGLRSEQADLAARRSALAALEGRQRLAQRATAGDADREADRALALAEQARDLGSLADELGRAGALRDRLAELPGPIMRPPPGALAATTLPAEPEPTAAVTPGRAAPNLLLPVQGRIIAGFGASLPDQPVSRGLALAPRPGAQVVAPGQGRIVFAGPYRGFGQIVIVDLGQGWTALVTGLGQLGVRVGDTVVAGSPIGTAGPARPVVSFELRRDGQPVNPLDFARP